MTTRQSPDFRKAFLDELLATERYLGQQDARRGHAFTRAVFDFAYAVVAPLPEAFPVYRHPLLPQLQLRRAIFRRTYALLYEVGPAGVTFVYFYHTRRDISQQDFGQ